MMGFLFGGNVSQDQLSQAVERLRQDVGQSASFTQTFFQKQIDSLDERIRKIELALIMKSKP